MNQFEADPTSNPNVFIKENMNNNAGKISCLSLSASILIAAQIIIILLKGEAICLNDGCKILENLTVIPMPYFNLLGLIYFQIIFWTIFPARNKPEQPTKRLKILLIAGLSVEGVLLSYQIFVAETFCSYCLIIFTIVLVLNAMAGRQHLFNGASVLIGIIFIFSLLDFGPSLLLSSQNQTLNAGTYGTRTCTNPTKQVYLFFSENCAHCKKVIKALENCNSCNFHFNPVNKLKNIELVDVVKTASYSPEVNRLMLTLLGIQDVPVLLAKDLSGLSIIKGEEKIISYIKQSCYQKAPLLYFDTSGASTDSSMSVYKEEDGCSMTIDCNNSKNEH